MTEQASKVLYIEDDSVNRELVRKLLVAADFVAYEAHDGLKGIELALNIEPDLILLDISIPNLDGFEVATRIKSIEKLRNVPLIALTAHAMPGDRERCITAGCDGYIAKPIDADNFVSLINSYLAGQRDEISKETSIDYLQEHNRNFAFRLEAQVRELLATNKELERIHEDLEQRAQLQAEKIVQDAYLDPLTRLPNRKLFMDRLKQAIAQVSRNDLHSVLIFLDLDDFKTINDKHGHGAGDHVLKVIGLRLANIIHSSDTAARLGGDEFVFIISNLKAPDDASIIAKRILDSIAEPIVYDSKTFKLSGSIGITELNNNETIEAVIKNADSAMYKAKNAGKHQYRFYAALTQSKVEGKEQLKSALQLAIKEDQFALFYQPVHDLESGDIIGVETFIRWIHPENGLVSPAYFLPCLEETGMMSKVGQWVIESACRQIMQWRSAGLPSFPVTVNVSMPEIIDDLFVSNTIKILEQTGCPADTLELEFNESSLVEYFDITSQHLNELHAKGVKLSMDDFGTGYSSLSYLTQFSLNTLKLDRTLINESIDNERKASIFKSITTLADSLNTLVVAENIETSEQVELIKSLGCNAAQGSYFSLPMSVKDFEDYLHSKGQK